MESSSGVSPHGDEDEDEDEAWDCTATGGVALLARETHVSQLPFTQPAFDQRPEPGPKHRIGARANKFPLPTYSTPCAHRLRTLNPLLPSPAMATNPNAYVQCSRGISSGDAVWGPKLTE